MPQVHLNRRLSGRGRSDAVAMAAMPAAYLLQFQAWPETSYDAWFHRWLPQIVAGYGAYSPTPGEFFVDTLKLVPAVVLALVALWLGRSRPVGILVAASLAGVVGFLVQRHGYDYHMIPAYLFAAAAAATVASERDAPDRPLAFFGVAVTLAVMGWSVGRGLVWPWTRTVEPTWARIEPYVRPGEPVGWIDPSINPQWPDGLDRGHPPAIRFTPAFPLAFLYKGADGPDPYRNAASSSDEERRVFAEIAEDLDRGDPPVVVVCQAKCLGCPPGFDVDHLLDVNGFKAAHLSNYSPVDVVEQRVIYVRKDRL